MRMEENLGGDKTPDSVKDLVHKINEFIKENSPEGTEFSCLMAVPVSSVEDQQLVLATNQSGPMEVFVMWEAFKAIIAKGDNVEADHSSEYKKRKGGGDGISKRRGNL